MANDIRDGDSVEVSASDPAVSDNPNDANLKPDRLTKLAPELQNLIIDQLGYLDGIHLRQVSQYFYSTTHPARWTRDQASKGVHEAEKWERHNRIYFSDRLGHSHIRLIVISDGYACYQCCRVLDKSKFSRRQTEGPAGKHMNGPTDRFDWHRWCIDCCIEWGYYKAGQRLNVMTKQSTTVRHGKMWRTEVEVKSLRVCEHCAQACEFISVDAPHICNDCATSQTQVDESDGGTMVLKRGKHGYETLECLGCHGHSEVATKIANLMRCAGCDEYICKICSAVLISGCKCDEAQEQQDRKNDRPMLDRLFDPSKAPRKTSGDILSDEFDGQEEIGMLEMLNI